MRKLILLLAVFMPGALKKAVYRRIFGWTIHPSVSIGLSYIDVINANFEKGAKIGHFNIFSKLDNISLGQNCKIGNFNRAGGQGKHGRHFKDEQNRVSAFILGAHASVTSRHYFDCSNRIHIGDFCTIAGMGSLFFTHGISIEENKQQSAPIEIGRYTMMGAACVVTKGAVLPNYSILAAGSVLGKALSQEYMIYGGVPAGPIKEISKDAKYFHRTTLFVD